MVYRDETGFDSSKDWTVDELRQFILEKKYGKDVRGAIAYALAKVYSAPIGDMMNLINQNSPYNEKKLNSIGKDPGYSYSSGNSNWWAFEKYYAKGFIKKIKITVTTSSDVSVKVALINRAGKVLSVQQITGNGTVEIPINEMIKDDFYLAIKAPFFKYTTNLKNGIRYSTTFPSDLNAGDIYTPIWKTDSVFTPVVEVVYTELSSLLYDLVDKSQNYLEIQQNKITNFDDAINPGGYWVSVDNSSDVVLENAPENSEWGYYAVINIPFYEDLKMKFMFQIATTYVSDKGKGIYLRYLVVKSDGTIDESNQTIRQWLPLLNNDISFEKNRVFIAGDSITAGHPYESETNIAWANQVGKHLNLNVTRGANNGSGYLFVNAGKSAITIVDSTDFTNYDIAILAFGTNDYGNNITLGKLGDNYPTNQTLYGAIDYVINKIYNSNPEITLILSTPINRSDHGTKDKGFGYGTNNDKGYTLSDVVDAEIEVAKKYGVICLDNRQSPFNVFSLNSLLVDKLHPTRDGYKVLGSYLSARIGSYIKPYKV